MSNPFYILKNLTDKNIAFPAWMKAASNQLDAVYNLLRSCSAQLNDLNLKFNSALDQQALKLHPIIESEAYRLPQLSGEIYGDGYELTETLNIDDFYTDIPTRLKYSKTIAFSCPEMALALNTLDTLSGEFFIAGASGIYEYSMDGILLDSHYPSIFAYEEDHLNFDNYNGAKLSEIPITGSFELYNIYELDELGEAKIVTTAHYVLSGDYVYIDSVSGEYFANYNYLTYNAPLTFDSNCRWAIDVPNYFVYGFKDINKYTPIAFEKALTDSNNLLLRTISRECRPGKNAIIKFQFLQPHFGAWDSSGRLTISPSSNEIPLYNVMAFAYLNNGSEPIYYTSNNLYKSYIPGSIPIYPVDVSGIYDDKLISIYPVNQGNLLYLYFAKTEKEYILSGTSSYKSLEDPELPLAEADYEMSNGTLIPYTVFEIADSTSMLRLLKTSIQSDFLIKIQLIPKGVADYNGRKYFLTDQFTIFDDAGNTYYLTFDNNDRTTYKFSTSEISGWKSMYIDGTLYYYHEYPIEDLTFDAEAKICGFFKYGSRLCVIFHSKNILKMLFFNPMNENHYLFEFPLKLSNPKDARILDRALYILDGSSIKVYDLKFDYFLTLEDFTYFREKYTELYG